jgi:hypothetical protein
VENTQAERLIEALRTMAGTLEDLNNTLFSIGAAVSEIETGIGLLVEHLMPEEEEPSQHQ